MVERAVALGLGEAGPLSSRFDHWRKIGLLPGYREKEARKGGAGLYLHAVFDIWVAMLKNRLGGCNVTTLANLTVFAWVWGLPAFDTATAKAAMSYWAGTEKSRRGDQSIRDQFIRSIVDDISSPTSSVSNKQRLRRDIWGLASGRDAIGVAPSFKLRKDIRAVLSPDSSEDAVRDVAEQLHASIRFQAYGALHLKKLCLPRDDSTAFFEWARDFQRGTLGAGVDDWDHAVAWLQSLSQDSPEVAVIQATAERSCRDLLFDFGVGLMGATGGIWPRRVPRPPDLAGIKPPLEWGDTESELRLIFPDSALW